MFTELAPLLKSLDGKSYKQTRALMKMDDFDYRAIINWWKLIPQRRRKVIKHRLHLFLFWREKKFGNWKKFMKLWRQRSPARRKKMLLRWRNRQGAYRHKTLSLIIKVIRDDTITKKAFRYLMRPLTQEQLQRLQLFLWAKLQNCRNHAVVIKTTGSEPCLEIMISPHGPKLYF